MANLINIIIAYTLNQRTTGLRYMLFYLHLKYKEIKRDVGRWYGDKNSANVWQVNKN